MSDRFSFALTLFSLVGALVVLTAVVRGRYRWSSVLPLLLVLEAGLLLQALVDATGLAGLVGEHRPAEPGVHAAYAVVSVLTLPVAAVQSGRDDDRWSGAVVGVALVVVAVVVVRMQTTWRSG